jgi:transposase
MEVTTGTVGDPAKLASLLDELDDLETVSADSGYLSRRNCMVIEAKGARPYLKPTNWTLGKPIGPPAWKRMIRSYMRDRHSWMRHYNTRSMAETAFSAIKRTLGHKLTSVRRDHQKLELRIKVIVYNINVLIKSRRKGI